MKRCEIAIIGGGPAGATLAALAAGAGWSVAVIEKAPFPRRKVCGEYLSATSVAILDRVGVGAAFAAAAGPEIHRVGFFAGDVMLSAQMPAAKGGIAWGRALGRETLDTLLLRRAEVLGAEVLQSWSATALRANEDGWRIAARSGAGEEITEIAARIVVAAHGSWETGALPSQPQRRAPRSGDLFGFKAHFRVSALPADLMPLLVFPGGYGGMVTVDGERVSLSCCVRRDRLAALRGRNTERRAGEAVIAHIVATTRGVRDALAGAALDGAVLAAGPIWPGVHAPTKRGVLCIGNAAGEAHPIVAEGITMAMQSAALLFRCLERERKPLGSAQHAAAMARVAREYERRWRLAFAPRILASTAFANIALRAPFAAVMRRTVGLWPSILTAGAYFAGKTKFV